MKYKIIFTEHNVWIINNIDNMWIINLWIIEKI